MDRETSKVDRTWSISELAREFAVTPRALRFYEDRGLLSPARDGQTRAYGPRDRARLRLIVQGKRLGFALADIGAMLDLYEHGGQRAQMQVAQKNFRERVAALQRQRAEIDSAIEELNGHLAVIDERLAGPDPGEAMARAFDQVAQQRMLEA